MPTKPKFLIIPAESVGEAQALARLEPDQIRRIDVALSDKSLLKKKEPARAIFQAIAAEIGTEQASARDVVTAIKNLRRQRDMFTLTDEQVVDDLAIVTDSTISGDKREALIALLRRSDEDLFVEKVAALRHAVGEHMVGARTIVEARPVFSPDRQKMDGVLLVTYLEISTHSAGASDAYTAHTIQISRKDIADLKEKLSDAEVKLTRLEAQFSGIEQYE
jgi:hypothetical protein